jgi:hypothetical protein
MRMPVCSENSSLTEIKSLIISRIQDYAKAHKSYLHNDARVIDISLEKDAEGISRCLLNSAQVYGSCNFYKPRANASAEELNLLLDKLATPFETFSLISTNRQCYLELVINQDKTIHVFQRIGPNDELELNELAERDDDDAVFIASLVKPIQQLLAIFANKQPLIDIKSIDVC